MNFLVYLVTIAVSVQDRPSAAPKTNLDEAWMSDWKLYNKPTFIDAMAALSTIVFAYAGTPLFFPLAAEMREPRHYTKAMLLCQGVATATYLIVGIIIYYFCGSYVASPALGSAGKIIKQAAYGLALPGLIVGATINTHVGSHILNNLDNKALTCQLTGDWQICIRSNPSRLEASYSKHFHPLGHMAKPHLRHCLVCIHNCERHPGIWQSSFSRWSSARYSPGIPTVWLFLAVRQLE
jgi:hypothetical protein